MKKTKAAYEALLNIIGADRKYGTKLRRNDPIQFNVSYNDWLRRLNGCSL